MKDIYGAMRFDNIYDLKNFLNMNEIEPKNVVAVNVNSDHRRIELLYIKDGEVQNESID